MKSATLLCMYRELEKILTQTITFLLILLVLLGSGCALQRVKTLKSFMALRSYPRMLHKPDVFLYIHSRIVQLKISSLSP